MNLKALSAIVFRVQLLMSLIICFPLRNGLYGREITIKFYHGYPEDSRVVEIVENGVPRIVDGTKLTLIEPEGSEVSVEIINANPIYYSYIFEAGVDTTKIELPDISSFLSFVNSKLTPGAEQLIPNLSIMSELNLKEYALKTRINQYFQLIKKSRNAIESPMWWEAYAEKILRLKTHIEEVIEIDGASDTPESYPTIQSEKKGFKFAKETILGLPRDSGGFNDPTLENTLDQWYSEAKSELNKQAVKGTPSDDILLEALKAYGESLLNCRNSLRTAYRSSSTSLKYTKSVGKGLTTFTLNISSNKEGVEPKRATGEKLIIVEVEPEFERPLVELMPVAYATFTKSVPQFEVIDGVIARTVKNEEFDFRAGGMLVTNLYDFGSRKEFAISLGLGSNLFGGSDALSEFYLGGFFSFRELFRVGVGWGRIQIPILNSGVKAGDPLPAGKSLEDVTGEEDKSAVFLLFSLKGITFPL